MGRRTVAQFANQIKRVLSPTRLDDLGRRVGFCRRERLITPYRPVLNSLASHATGQVETLAGIQPLGPAGGRARRRVRPRRADPKARPPVRETPTGTCSTRRPA